MTGKIAAHVVHFLSADEKRTVNEVASLASAEPWSLFALHRSLVALEDLQFAKSEFVDGSFPRRRVYWLTPKGEKLKEWFTK